jgi:eukaryotic-like serine/threonine-protein kinase
MNRQAKRFYAFGPFRFDPDERLLLREGKQVPLSPKLTETLFLLVQNAGHLVDKEELMKRVWPDAFVEDGNLNKNISVLRKTLGQWDGGREYIETIPKGGYRFVGAVNEVNEDESPQLPMQASDTSATADCTDKRQILLLFSTAVLIAALTLLAFLFHRTPALTENDTIVVADFTNTTGESVFDPSLKQALTIQFRQSPFLNILPEDSIRESLLHMGRSQEDRMTATTTREICIRRGLKAMLSGSISKLGRDYIIGLEARNCRTGDLLAQQQVLAHGKEGVLQGLDKAASGLRAQLGESLSSIQNYDSPLEQATTPSLEALHAYSLAQRERARGAEYEAIPFFERAIELDPNFAMANGILGVTYDHVSGDISIPPEGHASSQGFRKRAVDYLQKAFELRDRVSQRERFYISAHYYEGVTHDLDKQDEIYELWKRIYPRDPIPYTNLGANYADIGKYKEAAENATEAVRLAPDNAYPYAALANAYLGLNQTREARAVCDKAIANKLDGRGIQWLLYHIAFIQNDTAAMQRQLQWAKNNGEEQGVFFFEALRAAFLGKLKASRELFDQSRRTADATHDKQIALSISIQQALMEAKMGYARRANGRIIPAKAAVSESDRNAIAITLALSGNADHAQALIDSSVSSFPQDSYLNNVLRPSVYAAIEINRNNPNQAIDLLWSAVPYELGRNAALLPIYLRGQAYLQLHAGKEAAIEFRKIIDHPGIAPFSLFHVLALPGLARALALQGDTANSRVAYEDFFTFWKDADPEIPMLRAAQREYANLR